MVHLHTLNVLMISIVLRIGEGRASKHQKSGNDQELHNCGLMSCNSSVRDQILLSHFEIQFFRVYTLDEMPPYIG